MATEEDMMAATLAAARKLASSEDTAPVEEEEEDDKVWLRARDTGDWWGKQPMRGKPRHWCPY